MKYHFDATEDFLRRQNEIYILLEIAKEETEDDKHKLFLKLVAITLVTKFQVYVENVLKEYLYQLRSNHITYSNISIYMQLNSVKIKANDNDLIKLSKHNKLNEDTKNKIENYLKSISFIIDSDKVIDDNFNFITTFPLGRTGKDELLKLFKQIDGDENIFINKDTNEEILDLNQLDSLLLTRHLIIHQDIFNQTIQTIAGYRDFLLDIVIFCDNYLYTKLQICGVALEERCLEYPPTAS
ncbi:MAG TPA: hypothetical protein DIC60_09655 [Lachnospiraceae bacterium]|nr:hypothetical protein [Lachnospiraceae bacterium]